MRALLLAATATVVAAGVSVAHAGEPPAHAIGAIAVSGDAEAPLGDALRPAADEGLRNAKVAVIAHDTVAKILSAVPELGSCSRKDCLARLAGATGAARLVAIDVESKDELYRLTVRVVDASGRGLRVRRDECVPCAVPDVAERLTAMVADAAGAAADDTVAVEITSEPTAHLAIDGAAQGTTPWHGPLVAGAHHLAISDDDRGRSIEQDVFVEVGDGARFDLAIPTQHHKRRWGRTAYATAGGGGLFLLSGIVLLAIDGNDSCGTGGCYRERETTAAGLGFVVVGLAAGAAGGWMIWQDRKAERSAVTVMPTAGGAAATFTIGF